MKLHIFDVDFTIVSCSTVRAFIFRGLREGLIGPSIGFYAPLLFLRYGVKAKPERADERAYPFLTGVARADLEALSRALFEEVLRRRIDVAVAGRIETILAPEAGRSSPLLPSEPYSNPSPSISGFRILWRANSSSLMGSRRDGYPASRPSAKASARESLPTFGRSEPSPKNARSIATAAATCPFFARWGRRWPSIRTADSVE